MKVYVLNKEYVHGMFNGMECVGVFDTEEKAQKVMEGEIKKIEKKWTEEYGTFENAKNIDTTIGVGVATISIGDRSKYYIVSEREVK